jgi:hypothetical protein
MCKALRKGEKPSTLDSGPTFWGFRILQDVPRFARIVEGFEILQGNITETNLEHACNKTNEINQLYKDPSDGAKSTKKKVDSLPRSGDGYENCFLDIKPSKAINRFALDIFNVKSEKEKESLINGMLWKMVKPTLMRTRTWAVKKTGNFSYKASVEERPDLFATEEMPIKCHVYVKSRGKLFNVLNLADKKDEMAEYERWKKKRFGRPPSHKLNRIEFGINHIVVVLEPLGGGKVKVEEVYLDGDRMVVK